ncbi:MAG TPA: DNA-binding response regulator [Acholeplasmatales bacterium]|nr:DNA-binding response regulator [Acholeplasmatales bacterium]
MIYCVEDDRGIRELVIYTLQNTGFAARGFENGKDLQAALGTQRPDLILLDIMLPGENGIEILKKLRADSFTRTIPVVMLTAKGTEYDKVIGLDSGADDYIVKPFGMMELISRIKAVLRRTESIDKTNQISFGGVTINLKSHSVTVDGSPVELTLKEFELLRLLLQNPGTVLTRDDILGKIWGYDFDGETRTVDVHIRTLRQKMGEKGEIIATIRGVGYIVGGSK